MAHLSYFRTLDGGLTIPRSRADPGAKDGSLSTVAGGQCSSLPVSVVMTDPNISNRPAEAGPPEQVQRRGSTRHISPGKHSFSVKLSLSTGLTAKKIPTSLSGSLMLSLLR